jgi:hypothetical protein
MSTRPTQAVIAVLRMSGVQDVQVDASHPHTDDAAVVVRVGKSLLYVHELRTAEHLAEPWTEAAKLIKMLPMYSARDAVKPIQGMPDPAVITHASGKPTCQVNSLTDRGGQPFLRVQLGRLIYEVRDQHALVSCVETFRDARNMARLVFKPKRTTARTAEPVRAATEALGPPTDAAQERTASPRTRPRTTQPDARQPHRDRRQAP